MSNIPLEAGDTGKRIFRGLPGNPQNCQKCGAKTRRGTACRLPAERNPRTGRRTRCRLHGGLSTGPRTPEGLARMAAANTRHGRRTKAAKLVRKELRAKLAELKAKTRELVTV